MRNELVAGLLCCIAGTAADVSIPFAGCTSFGQVRKLAAPEGTSRLVRVRAQDARALAYYQSADGIGLVGPRGWYCQGVSGSSGYALFLTPKPIDYSLNGWKETDGPAIELNHVTGDNSGRFDVAEVVARVFPAYREDARDYQEGYGIKLPSGPYPSDRLTYRGKKVVEYQTPAGMDGLGTHSWLIKGDTPIVGTAILIGDPPDLLLLSVRLPRNLSGLSTTIIREVEREATRKR